MPLRKTVLIPLLHWSLDDVEKPAPPSKPMPPRIKRLIFEQATEWEMEELASITRKAQREYDSGGRNLKHYWLPTVLFNRYGWVVKPAGRVHGRKRFLNNPHVYHRSTRKFDALDPAKRRFGDYGPGFYFSEADSWPIGSHLYEADFDPKNPLDVEGAPQKEVDRILRAMRIDKEYLEPGGDPPLVQAMGLLQAAWEFGEGHGPESVARVLEKLGYDGIVVPSKGYWVAFKSDQAEGFRPVKKNPDEGLRRRQRRAVTGGPVDEARSIAAMLRSGLDRRNVWLAAYLGHEPSQLVLGWDPPAPGIWPPAVMSLLAQHDPWSRRACAILHYAVAKGTEWIWDDLRDRFQGHPELMSQAPARLLKLVKKLLDSGVDPLDYAKEEGSLELLMGFDDRINDLMEEVDQVAAGYNVAPCGYRYPGGLGGPRTEETDYRVFSAGRTWLEVLDFMTGSWEDSSVTSVLTMHWDGKNPYSTTGGGALPLCLRNAMQAYRRAIFAVLFYRVGGDDYSDASEPAQADVDRWTLRVALPYLLGGSR